MCLKHAFLCENLNDLVKVIRELFHPNADNKTYDKQSASEDKAMPH